MAEAAAAAGRPLAGYLDAGNDPQPPTPLIPAKAGTIPRLGDEGRLADPAFLAAHELVVAVQGPARRGLCERIAAAGRWATTSPSAPAPTPPAAGEAAFIGLGALIQNRLNIGPHATVGAGAVVTRDVPEGATVVGNPARVLEKR